MVEKIYNKLVRDKIPETISARGHVPVIRELSGLEFRAALKQKLLEEAAEAAEASSNDDILSELADLTEVIESLTVHAGFSLVDLKAAQTKKRSARGGFEKKIFLEKVDEN